MKREDAGINRCKEHHRDSIQLPGTQTSAISEHANKNGYHSLWDNWGYSATRKTANTWIISGMFLMLWPITTMIRRYELQWGTKALRHFPKMAPFCIVGIPIPFPCLPQHLPSQNQCCSLDPQVLLLLQTTLIRGLRGFTAFNEIINELNVW